MSNKVKLIIFTYRRAMSLDLCLRSAIKNFSQIDKTIEIIKHYDDTHEESYIKLKEKFSNYNIRFHTRSKKNFFSSMNLFLYPLNFLWLARWPSIFKDFNNFKYLLEDIIKNSDSNFISFCPDDTVFFKKVQIDNHIFSCLDENFNSTQFRYFVGDHLKEPYDINQNLNIKYFNSSDNKNRYFKWNLRDKFASRCWNYRFTIEGTVYNKQGLLNLLKPLIYHNPITLEAIGLWESRFRNFFENGIATKERKVATYQINNVQKLVENQCAYFDPYKLMKLYLKGYLLEYDNSEFDKNFMNVVPETIYLKKDGTSSIFEYKDLIKQENL